MKRARDELWIMLGALLLAAPLAHAQDEPPPPADGAEEPVEPVESDDAQASELPPYAEGWRWLRRSPIRGEAVEDVAVKPGAPDHLVAVDGRGRVWRSDDGGRIWAMVFGQAADDPMALSSDEEVLLDIDARLQEVLTDGDTLDLDPELDESGVEDAVGVALADAIDFGGSEVLTDLESDPGFMLRGSTVVGDAPPRIVYIGERLFAAVGGTLYLSNDDGRTWGEVLERDVFDIVRLGTAFVALTDDGARIALEPRSWVDFDDGTEGRRMVDGATTSEVLLAATESGLWATRDGQNWERWGETREPVRAVSVHPDAPNVVWAAAISGLLRSEDRGLSFGAPVLPGRIDDVVVPSAGRVVVVRPGNVLESVDDGVTWRPATRGLPGVSGGRLETTEEGGLLLAAPDGLWALQPIGQGSTQAAGPWMGLEDLVVAALRRGGIAPDFDPFRRRYTAAVLPSLQVDGYWFPPGERAGRLGWNEQNSWTPTGGTAFERDVQWFVRARLTWTPRRSRNVSLQDLGESADIDTNVVIIGDEPLLLTGRDDYVVAARLQRALATEQGALATTVTDLYRTRAELVAERSSLGTARLQRQVNHELAIAELEAQLDALTLGAVTRWQATQAISSKEL